MNFYIMLNDITLKNVFIANLETCLDLFVKAGELRNLEMQTVQQVMIN
jgi:hypothetical protein